MAHYLSNPELEAKEYVPRYKWLYAIVGFVLLVIFCRLWYLQIIQGPVLREFSEKNRIKETRIDAPRGVILDRNGEVLVDNLPGFTATITPQYAKHLQETSAAVSRILAIPKNNIIKQVKRSRRRNGPFFPVKIKENLSREEVFRLKLIRLNHPGLEINETIVRSYPLKENGAQLFGYVGEISKKQLPLLNKKRETGTSRFRQGDIIGKAGLEERFDGQIRGRNGVSFFEVDARGRELSRGSSFAQVLGKIARFRPAEPGHNIQLTIDKDVQSATFKAFNETGRIGSVVALKPNGEIISWVSSPSFNPNDFSTGLSRKLWQNLINDPFRPLRNKAIQDHNSPGSTFKPIVALAALQEKIITPKTTYYCPGFFKFAGRPYHCHAKHGHGNVNVFEAIERSCNVFFYKLGVSLGVDKIAKYAKALGVGRRTEVQLSNEVPGLMPTSKWKMENRGEEWQPGENLSTAIGQGFILTTPLQMALAYSALGTNGKIYKPLMIKSLLDHKGQKIEEFAPEYVENLSDKENPNFISVENFEHIKKGMQMVVNGSRGTARGSRLYGVDIAGKTGTGQLFSFAADQVYAKCDEKPIKQRHHGWFVGFAPANDPVLTVAVLAEHSCSGSRGAAPVVRDVIRSYIKKYHPDLLLRKKVAHFRMMELKE